MKLIDKIMQPGPIRDLIDTVLWVIFCGAILWVFVSVALR